MREKRIIKRRILTVDLMLPEVDNRYMNLAIINFKRMYFARLKLKPYVKRIAVQYVCGINFATNSCGILELRAVITKTGSSR